MTIDCKALTLLIFAKGVLSFTAAPFYSSCSNDISQSIDSGWKKYKLQGAINSQIDTFLCASGSSSLQKENSTSVETKNQDPSWLEEDLIERPASASAEEPTDASTIDEECDISSMLEDGDEEEDDEEYARLAGGMAESVDLTRENAKLDSLGSYLVVSCLVSTTAFNTVEGLSALVGSSIPTELVVFHDLAMVVASIVTFMGIYATVIFSLCVTYGRTSIGMNRDFLFDYFMQNTGEIREKGFRAYLASLYLFMIQILLVIAQTMDSSIRYPVLIGSTLLVSFMFKDWVKIMDLAGSMFDDSDPTMQSLDEEYKKKRGYKD